MNPILLWDSITTRAVTATDTEATGDYDPAYVSDLKPFTRWRADTVGTKYLTEPATTTGGDSLVISGHNLGTNGATVSVESSATGAWGGEEVERLAGFIPSDDTTLYRPLDTEIPDGHYVRTKIISAAAVPELGVLLIGARMPFPVWPDSPFTPFEETINAASSQSKGGHLLGVSEYFTPLRCTIPLTNIPTAFVEGDYRTFWEEHGKKRNSFAYIPNYTEWPDRVYWLRYPAGAKWGWPQSDMAYIDKMSLVYEGVAE